jgi:hypothetical protein
MDRAACEAARLSKAVAQSINTVVEVWASSAFAERFQLPEMQLTIDIIARHQICQPVSRSIGFRQKGTRRAYEGGAQQVVIAPHRFAIRTTNIWKWMDFTAHGTSPRN